MIDNIRRCETLLKEVMEGRMIGKRPRGRKRLGMLNDFSKRSIVCGMKKKDGKQEIIENDGS